MLSCSGPENVVAHNTRVARPDDPLDVATAPLEAVATFTAAVGTAQTLPSIYQAALNGIREGFGVDRAAILLFDRDGVMRFKAWRDLSDDYRAAIEGYSPWTRGQAAPEPIIVADARNDASFSTQAAVFKREGIVALAFFPLVSDGRVIGTFVLYQGHPESFTPEQISAGKAMGFLLGFAVERTQRIQEAVLERRRLIFALDAANMGTWDWDIASSQVRWSENLERVHGLPPGSFSGGFDSYEREIHPEDRLRVTTSLQRALLDDTAHDVEYRIVAPDGTIRWVQGKGRVERDARGEPVRMTGVCMDISGRRRIEAENDRLFEDAQRLLAVEEALRSRLTTLTDESFRLLTSLRRESVVDEVIALAAKVVPADAYAVWRRHGDEWTVASSRGLSEPFTAARLTDEWMSFDQPIVATDLAQESRLSGRAAAYAAEGIVSLVSVPLVVRGVTTGSVAFYYRVRHRPSEAELRVKIALGHLSAAAISNAELYAEAQQANRLKDEFLATLSHELRTPLNVIAGRSRMLTTVPDVETARQLAEVIDRNSATLARLVDDLLDVSRMAIGQVRLERQAVDLPAVVAAAVQAVQSAAEARSVSVRVAVAPTPALTGDPTRIQQIIWNLLTNAVKFTPPDGLVEVTSVNGDGDVTLTVRDSGQGLDPAALPHVFEMFWQAEPLSARKHGGLGLGLSIVRTLVELHGGRVRADSDGAGQGAAFTVTLPCSLPVAG